MLLTSWGVGLLYRQELTLSSARIEEACVWSKLVPFALEGMSPQIFLFSFFGFLCPPSLYLYHHCSTFTFWSSSLSSWFQVFFLYPSYIPFLSHLSNKYALTEKILQFSPWHEIKGGDWAKLFRTAVSLTVTEAGQTVCVPQCSTEGGPITEG